MKKLILILLSLSVILLLTACGEASSETNPENADANSADGRSFATRPEMKLMLGTVKLEETDQAIDSSQAAELLPLWKALRSLVNSDTAAQAEIDAIINQIQETMTPEQMAAIDAMNLTMQDFASVSEILGIELGTGGGQFGEMTPEMQATMEAMRESSEFPGEGEFSDGGEFPGGGPGFGGGQGLGGGQEPGSDFDGAGMDPSARETAMAESGGTFDRGFGINTQLLDAIIEFLEAKIQ